MSCDCRGDRYEVRVWWLGARRRGSDQSMNRRG